MQFVICYIIGHKFYWNKHIIMFVQNVKLCMVYNCPWSKQIAVTRNIKVSYEQCYYPVTTSYNLYWDKSSHNLKTCFACTKACNYNENSPIYFGKSPFEAAHEIMLLITYATSEDSGEPAHLRSLGCAGSAEPSLFAHMKYGSRRKVPPKSDI